LQTNQQTGEQTNMNNIQYAYELPQLTASQFAAAPQGEHFAILLDSGEWMITDDIGRLRLEPCMLAAAWMGFEI
jgi:hypothetical protein